MKKLFTLIAALSTSLTYAATINCFVQSENEDGRQVKLLKETQELSSQFRSAIKKTFNVGSETLELSVTTQASRIVPGAATIGGMQIVTPGWERLQFPSKGAYTGINKYNAHVPTQKLFLVSISDVDGEKNYITAECEISQK